MIELTTTQAYNHLVEQLLDEPVQSSRAGDTRELLNVVVRSENPRDRFIMRPNFNLAFALQECWAYWNGANPGYVHRYNSEMENYMTDGKLQGSAYGDRIRNIPHDQILRVISQLQQNPDTRRAVMMIHQPDVEDYQGKDVACTLYAQLMIRDGKLHMTVNLRSQDIYWGYPYDVQAFQWMQDVIAGHLNVELGTYTHIMNSLHLYTEYEDAIRDSIPVSWYQLPSAEISIREMTSLTAGLSQARAGNHMKALHTARTLPDYYADWLRVMSAYEQHRFHGGDPMVDIQIEPWRQWVDNL